MLLAALCAFFAHFIVAMAAMTVHLALALSMVALFVVWKNLWCRSWQANIHRTLKPEVKKGSSKQWKTKKRPQEKTSFLIVCPKHVHAIMFHYFGGLVVFIFFVNGAHLQIN